MNTHQFNVRMPVDLYLRLRDEAKLKGVTIHSIVLNALWDYLNK